MTAKLFCKFGKLKGTSFEIDKEVVVGREKPSDLLLKTGSVSSRHARIYLDPKRHCYILEDLGSLNGTLLDGRLLTAPEPLENLHIINFGGASDFFFQDSDRSVAGGGLERDEAKVAPERASDEGEEVETHGEPGVVKVPTIIKKLTLQSAPSEQADDAFAAEDPREVTRGGDGPVTIPDVLAKQIEQAETLRSPTDEDEHDEVTPKARTFRLVLTSLDQVFELAQGENVVGRTRSLAICIPNGEVSRKHAVITVVGEIVKIRDLGSTNHTYVDRQEIKGELLIGPGTQLAFGKIRGVLEVKTDRAGDERSGS